MWKSCANDKMCILDSGAVYQWADAVLTDTGTTVVVPILATNTGSWVLRDQSETMLVGNLSDTEPAIAGQAWNNSGFLAISGAGIPTTDPKVVGHIWADAGVLKVSTGV